MRNAGTVPDVTASIVLYKNDKTVLSAIQSFVNTSLNVRLLLIDNSPVKDFQTTFADVLNDDRIEYFFCNGNVGYAKGHNIAIKKSLRYNGRYHLVLNPDIEFKENVLKEMVAFMDENEAVGQLMPKILYKDSSIQKLCKLLPTPFNLIGRRFFPNYKWADKLNKQYELENFGYEYSLNLPNLSGCFMFIRMNVLEKVGGFDERFFMYLEDIDLTRRINKISKTLFFPQVAVYHGYEKESYSNPVLLKYHINSAIKYFNKWGWFMDKDRKKLNKEVLREISLKNSR